ncbi:uncharacterized protein LOC107265307 isoform X2 [Cephus cinctus]|uniref:Uncharacterized protein LOC107265307 isoform X2 n=1 Tax=Cephus cinctus TaxID=211228 RepID=A0AAJ7RBP3_CEPCN|nr:uncharacterized protein LOC107265307 isoform X2 [Cephus cinctus]
MQTNVVLQTTRDIYSLIRNTRNTRFFTQPVTEYCLTVQRHFNVYTRGTTIDNNGYEKPSTKINASLRTDFIQEYMIPKTVNHEYEVFQNFRYRSKACASKRRVVLKNLESYSQVLHIGLLSHSTPRTLSVAVRHFSTNSASEHVGSNNIEAPLMVMTGIWKKLSECPPVEFVQNSLISLHSSTGLPWWATIVLATVMTRSIVTIPLSCYQVYITAKLHNLKYEMEDIVKELKKETNLAVRQFKWTEDYARSVYNRSLNTQWNKLIVRDNCHPMKGAILVIVQIPLWVILSITLRNLCYMLPHGDTGS